MPDRDVNVRVNLQAGQDTLSPQAQNVARALEEVNRAQAALAAQQPGAGGASWQGALSAALGDMKREQEAKLKDLARRRVDPGYAAAGKLPGVGAVTSATGILGAVGQGDLSGGISAVGSALSGISSSFLPAAGAMSAVGAVIGTVTTLVGALEQAFRRFRPSIAELTEELSRARGTTGRVRQTGVVTADDLRDALRGAEAGQAQAAQAGGDMGAFRSVLERALRRNRREARQLSAVDTGQMQSEIAAVLDEVMLAQRAQGGGLRMEQRLQYGMRLRQIYASRGLSAYMPAELESLPNNLTPQQARNFAEAGGTGLLARRQANILALQTSLSGIGSGLAPNLRPGAPSLADLPGIFQSRQTDFLDLHGQIQQEVVRDQREQQRYEAQMRLWEEISRNIAVMAGAPGAAGPTLADMFSDALSGLFGAG